MVGDAYATVADVDPNVPASAHDRNRGHGRNDVSAADALEVEPVSRRITALGIEMDVASFVSAVVHAAPRGAWYFGLGIVFLLIVVAVAIYGFKFSLGGRPLWKEEPA
jgi:hypothetical protein